MSHADRGIGHPYQMLGMSYAQMMRHHRGYPIQLISYGILYGMSKTSPAQMRHHRGYPIQLISYGILYGISKIAPFSPIWDE